MSWNIRSLQFGKVWQMWSGGGGAELEAGDGDGATALHAAANKGHAAACARPISVSEEGGKHREKGILLTCRSPRLYRSRFRA